MNWFKRLFSSEEDRVEEIVIDCCKGIAIAVAADKQVKKMAERLRDEEGFDKKQIKKVMSDNTDLIASITNKITDAFQKLEEATTLVVERDEYVDEFVETAKVELIDGYEDESEDPADIAEAVLSEISELTATFKAAMAAEVKKTAEANKGK